MTTTPRIVCQFSCGAASAVATKLALAQYGGTQDVQIINAFVKQEHEDNDLKRNGLQCLAIAPASRASQWRARKPEIEQMLAKGCRVPELAHHFKTSPDFIRKTLHRLGLKLGRIAPTPKAKAPRATKPKMHMGLQAVRSTSIKTPAVTNAPVEIIIPENVKITIAKFSPSPAMRVCNGTSSETYKPALHGGVMRAQRTAAQERFA